MPLYIDLFPETCYACTALTCTGRVVTPKCRVIPNQIPCQTLLTCYTCYTKPNVAHPMIDIYGAFGFSVTTFECMDGLIEK